ncbi:MAG TPA: shikimate dehydrogenase [Actinomycetota bacterium]
MSPSPTAATRVACIIGWPAARSLSPVIHNAAFAAAGLDWVYVAFGVAPDGLAPAVAGIRALGIAGANVTMPHKQAVLSLLDDVSPEAARIGAVNTIVNDDGRLTGYNTDGAGFMNFLTLDAGVDPSGAGVLLLGAGGAARALAFALAEAGARVTVAARNQDAAARVAAAAGGTAAAWDERADAARAATVIVNATPVGSDGAGPVVDAEAIAPGATVVDLIYAPASTPLLAAAEARGAAAFNGAGMLIHQAALSFERWTGTPAPLDAMRDAMRAAAKSASGHESIA